MKKADRPPYPVTGFLSFYEKLGEAIERKPHTIQEADFNLSRSGNELMMQTFRAYGLVGDNGQITEFFKRMAMTDEHSRRRMLREQAAALFEHFVTMMQRDDASEADLFESLDLLYGIQGSTAVKMVNHYNGASRVLNLPRSQDMPVMRGYRTAKLLPRPMPKRPAGEVGVGTPQSQSAPKAEVEVEVAVKEPAETNNTVEPRGETRPKPDTLARHYKMQAEYAELLLLALKNTVDNGDVPTEQLLARIDRFVGAGQTELPSPSSQGGTG